MLGIAQSQHSHSIATAQPQHSHSHLRWAWGSRRTGDAYDPPAFSRVSQLKRQPQSLPRGSTVCGLAGTSIPDLVLIADDWLRCAHAVYHLRVCSSILMHAIRVSMNVRSAFLGLWLWLDSRRQVLERRTQAFQVRQLRHQISGPFWSRILAPVLVAFWTD